MSIMNAPDACGRWSTVIFASRERVQTLQATLAAVVVAARSPMVIDVLVNGNTALAVELTRALESDFSMPSGVAVRVWSLSLGDKAHAWNVYFHTIWSGELLSFFIDGYVRLRPDAIDLLGHAVMADTNVLAGSGIPDMGRTAAKQRIAMLTEGGMHGNFCCVKGEVIMELRTRNIRLPIGLYRTDSLVGAILAFGLDPQRLNWDARRILVHPTATWDIDPKQWWNPDHIKAQIKRSFRQYRGIFENAAIKNHFVQRSLAPQQLPITINQLILDWALRSPKDVQRLIFRHPLGYFAMQHFRQIKDYSNAKKSPTLLWQRSQ